MGIVYIFYALFPKEFRIESLNFFLQNVARTKHQYKIFVIENKGPETVLGKLPADVTLIQRENVNMDFGAWAHAFDLLNLDFKEDDYCFFLNDTVVGPFVKPGVDWVQLYLDAFLKDVVVVSTTMVCLTTEEIPSPPFKVAVLWLTIMEFRL